MVGEKIRFIAAIYQDIGRSGDLSHEKGRIMFSVEHILAWIYIVGYLYTFGYLEPLSDTEEEPDPSLAHRIVNVLWCIWACLFWPALLGHLHGNIARGTLIAQQELAEELEGDEKEPDKDKKESQ